MNDMFFRKFTQMVQNVYNINVEINIFTLLKINTDQKINDILTLAFWSIYKLIVIRNNLGKDERKNKLWFMFLKEIYSRMQINDYLSNEGKQTLYNLPNALKMYF